MKVSFNWLKEFVDINVSAYELANKFTLSGLEVESVFDLQKACFDSIVGKILSKEKISNNLYRLDIDIGSKQCSIVTSDEHLEANCNVGLVLAGSYFNGLVKEKKFDNTVSEGFLLSGSDLKIEESSSNVLVLDDKYKAGTPLKELDEFNDFIFDISITPNRADCLSVLGLAREVCIYYNQKLKLPQCDTVQESGNFKITLDTDCPSYIASIMNVELSQSCFDMRMKLIKSGIRPINNVVDITNYCMLALGQPMHAFDKNKIGSEIIVRNAYQKEKIYALNDTLYELEEDLVIADESKAIAIAGIIGGKNSHIDANTTQILLESAYFVPERIRKTSRKLKLSTESSYRFERGIDPNLNEYATYYAIELLRKYANANGISISKNVNKKEPKKIEFDVEEINDFLGYNYPPSKFYQIGFDLTPTKKGFIATIPTYRVDIENMEDIAEEIARIDGYDKLPATLPCVNLNITTHTNIKDLIRETLKLSGLNEAINYSFVCSELLSKIGLSENLIYLKNPLTKEQDCMRTTLFVGLMNNLVFNLNRNIKSIAMFEVGKIFDLNGEYESLGIIMHGFKPQNWHTQKIPFDFYDIKGAFESIFGLFECDIDFKVGQTRITHPKKTLHVYNRGNCIGFFGQVHPDMYDIFDIKFLKSEIFYGEILLDSFTDIRGFKFKPLPKFPIVVRDLNIVVDKNENVTHIKKTISSFDFVYNVKLIDWYDLGSKKSLNFRIELYSLDKTLTDADIEQLINEIFSKLSTSYRATIRGG